MFSAPLGLAWYRGRASLRSRRGGLLAVVILVGLIGGLAMGSLAAARRTASSFSVFWQASNPSDLAGISGVLNPLVGSNAGYNAAIIATLAHLPHVGHVESASGFDMLPLNADGTPFNAPNFYPPSAGNGLGSVDGLWFDQNRVTVTEGRMANPARANEFMLSAQGAQALGYHVGETVPIGIYTNDQTNLPGFGTSRIRPHRVLRETLTGIIVFGNSVVQDDVDMEGSSNNLFTPALTRQLVQCCVNYTESGVRVKGGEGNVAAVTSAVNHALPRGYPPFFTTAPTVAKADRSIRPEAIALGVFGGIVALAALLIAGQLIGRQLLLAAAERRVLRALGANPAMTAADGLLLLIGAVLLGALLAVVVAISLSPLAPFGPVRAVYPYGGFSFDWTVLGAGFAVLVLGLATAAVVLGYRGAPHRVAARAGDGDRTSRTMSAVSASGLPPAAVEGIRFALGRRGGSEAVPMRSTIVGIVLAIVVLIGTVTFGASLDHLVSDPVLYGWNWDYALVAGADIPQHQAAMLLNRDHDIAAWSGDYTGTLDVGGTNIPVLGTPPNASVSPSILSGHPIGSDGQIVLGALTLAQLHRYLGQTVRVSNGVDPPVHLKIVGTAALPALGSATGGSHLELGVGGVVAYSLLPAAARNPFDNPVPGPNVTLVRLRNGVNRATALHSLQAIAHATTNVYNFGVFVSGVVRPAEIVNYRAMGGTPAYLSAGLAAGALTALTLTLVASVGRRRRDLALLKTLGFSRRQVAATVAWHATISVVLGVAVGIPLGIALGRLLWNLFARNINVVPSPSVPVEWVLAVGFGAIVLANVVAAFPARVAARTPTALALRSE